MYRLYLRPNTVPSRWDTVGAPGDFSPGGLTQLSGQCGRYAQSHNPETKRRAASAGATEGDVPGNATAHSPFLPPQLKHPPTKTTSQPQGEPLQPQAEATQPTAGRPGKGSRTWATGFQPRRPEEESPGRDTAGTRRSNPRTRGDSTVHRPERHCLQTARAYLLLSGEKLKIYIHVFL